MSASEKSTNRKAKILKKAEQVKVDPKKLAEIGGGQLKGFLDFVRTQGVIGLAVGLAIGSAAGDTVKKLVEGFINPIVQFLVGSHDSLASAIWHVELFGRRADFAWGAFVSSFISLIATALVIYWIVNVLHLDKIDKKKQ
jgi:large conductance mechanosensitive channel